MADSNHYDDDELPGMNEDVSNCVVVDNLPIVDNSKLPKLIQVLKATFAEVGDIVSDIYMPFAGDKSVGYCFVEYAHPNAAKEAVKVFDNKKVKGILFRVTLLNVAERLASMQPTYTEPNRDDFLKKKANLRDWLLDEHSRDQFVLRFADAKGKQETCVYWHDPKRKPQDLGRELVYGGEREKAVNQALTELIVEWSPDGNYLASFHKQGIVLWGGNFEKLHRFAHLDVQKIEFSPCCTYLVTFSPPRSEADAIKIIVWDIRTAKELRVFEHPFSETRNISPKNIFKWSRDGKYIAHLKKDNISIYETPSMEMLADPVTQKKTSIKINRVQNVQFSPHSNVLSYCVPERDANTPALVCLMEIPSRKIIRENHHYNATEITMDWQSKGDYLCVKVTRRKTKNTFVHNFEIFRMKQKDIPVDTISMSDSIIAFAWEPNGHRFAVTHASVTTTPAGVTATGKPSVSVYLMKKKSVELVGTLTERQCNALFWSPSGRHLVLAGLSSMERKAQKDPNSMAYEAKTVNGALEWVDTNNMSVLSPPETEHFNCESVEWDPSGRYLMTAATQDVMSSEFFSSKSIDNGYKVWTFQGEMLYTVPLSKCYQVLWRPRPVSPLPMDQRSKIYQIFYKADEKEKDSKKRDPATYEGKIVQKLEDEDEEIRVSTLSAELRERNALRVQWRDYRRAREQEHKELVKNAGVAVDASSDYEEITLTSEEEISFTNVVLDGQ